MNDEKVYKKQSLKKENRKRTMADPEMEQVMYVCVLMADGKVNIILKVNEKAAMAVQRRSVKENLILF